MFFLPVALVTAGAAALLNFWLGLRVSRLRMSEKILVGDGGNVRLIARMRAQLNFAEYAPLVLILIALIELAGGTRTWLWAVAASFIVGRVLHAFGMDGWLPGRTIGIAITMLTMLGLAGYAVYLGYAGLNPLR
ncbi:MAPEG family protein [Sphingomonas sp. DG1-23]|uniref:MAPEG family protein n=1 Tax=Sphingomonas sp. DG1-23 TaxID=3068316 RepID=UPI00273D5D01|nr:MAPEG family protein [Sphingomonas sp. DG1-23]MDP5280456.1 MAPEG family protein [Sphingomonas sp. DG1-23]